MNAIENGFRPPAESTASGDYIYGIVRCVTSGAPFVGAFLRESESYALRWAALATESSAGEAGSAINGELLVHQAYRGCPSCGARGIMLCSPCDHLSCIQPDAVRGLCAWCDRSADLTVGVDHLRSTGL